jgi:hypothetical protein
MATRWDNIPKFTDDVVKSAKEDAAKAQKGRNVDSSKLTGAAKDAVREAGARASNRNIGRGGIPAAALAIGYGAGRMLDEETGVGKKLVDKTVGPSIDRAIASEDRVTLSPSAKERIAAGELEEKEAPAKPRKRDTESASPSGKLRPGRNEEIDDETRENAGGYKKGGSVRGWGIARSARKAKIR